MNRKSLYFIIRTEKGYICDKNAKGYYEKSSNSFYQTANGAFFGDMLCNCNKVDKLGFTDNKKEATQFSYAYIGNRIQEIVDVIKFGYEKIKEIQLEPIWKDIKLNIKI